MKKRGVSPVVATVLLIAIVIVIGLIVFMWFRGISEEAITKFDGTNIKLVCEEVMFSAAYSDGYLSISNDGNVPIYQIKAKIEGKGSSETITLGQDDGTWPEAGLLIGMTYFGSVNVYSGDKILLIPVLVGETSEGERAHTCDDRHGKPIIVD